MSDILGPAYERGARFRRPGGWELLPAAQRWKRLAVISLSGAMVAAVPIIAVYHLYLPRDVFRVLFYTIVCAGIMGCIINICLVRFGRWMYLQPYPMNWALLAITILGGTASGSLFANLLFLTLQLLPDRTFWSSFWLVNQFAAVIALIFGLSGFANEVLRTTLEAATLELRTRQLEEERARKCALEAQLASLESHIRPHFLFNALNTISSLIHDDPKLAESLIGKLAALLRFSLDAPQRGLAPLASELKIVRDYLEIETARFGDRLRYHIDAPAALGVMDVPTFCLQTLVENSVKYAVATRAEGGKVEISAREGCVEVSDDGPGFTAEAILPGHGLDNLRGRMAALYGADGKLEIESNAGRTVVRLSLPQ